MPREPRIIEISPLFEVFGIRQIRDRFEMYWPKEIHSSNEKLKTPNMLISHQPPSDQTLVAHRLGLRLSCEKANLYRLLIAEGSFGFYVAGKRYLDIPFWAFLDPTLSVNISETLPNEVHADPITALSTLASECTLPFEGIARSFKVEGMALHRHTIWFEFRFGDQATSALQELQNNGEFFDIGIFLIGQRRTEL